MTTNIAAGTAAGGPSRRDRPDAGAPVILRELGRSFGNVRALDGLSLEIAPGEFLALLGPSGCGKTTALRIVAGFETADAGYVAVDGKDVSSIPAAKRDMGMVFQSYSLFPNMTALDNVGFGLRMRQHRSSELYAHPATPFVAEFVGTMNRIPAGLLAAGQVRAIGDAVQRLDGADGAVPGDVDLLVRPEELRIAAVRGGNGIVTDRTFLGSMTRVSGRLSGDVTVKVDLPSTEAAAMPPGTSVEIRLAGPPVLVAERPGPRTPAPSAPPPPPPAVPRNRRRSAAQSPTPGP